MMPAAQGMIPNHVLRVGQTVRLDPAQETVPQQTQPAAGNCVDDLEISLDNLNQLILELDPSFEPIPVNKTPSPIGLGAEDSDDDDSQCLLVARGCAASPLPTDACTLSPSIPIPTPGGLSCSPHGALVFTGSPSSSLPPLPCGSAPRRVPSGKQDTSTCTQGSLRLSHSNRNSATSLLSMSTCSDTSYILGSNLSLASEDADPPEAHRTRRSGSFSDGSRAGGDFDPQQSPDKSPPAKHLLGLHGKGVQSSPASLSGSLTDIPVLLVNGFPQQDVKVNQFQSPEFDLAQKPFSPQSYQAHFSGSQPSMKFVMDSSKFWFRPHISRAEAEALIRDKEAGTFVVRDSTSHRGSFGLAMKVDQSPTGFPASPGESSSDTIRHFLIESSAKGVRVRGSSQEPYFGSLSALVYQHTISAYALPCRLLLHTQELNGDEKASERQASSDNLSTASNFVYLNAVPTEMLTGPCAVQRAVSSTLQKPSGSFTPTIVNMKVSLKGVTLTDVNRKLFFRRHYPSHLLSYGGEDPDNRLWLKGSSFGARMFGFVAKGVEASMENVCHVFAEYDPLQPCNNVLKVVQAAVAKA